MCICNYEQKNMRKEEKVEKGEQRDCKSIGWIGLWLDERFDTTLCFLVMMLLGVLAAFRNFFQLVRGFYEKDLKRENAQQEYFDSMRREREKQKETKDGHKD